MATIVTRAGKGSPLTNTEVDANFTNLNTDKAELSGATFTGEIVANAGIALGDNDKATFGAGDDLQIYHSGSHSYIDEVGTGNLYVRSTKYRLANADGSKIYMTADDDTFVQLYDNNNAVKLATTATGIDVTGNVVADGLTVDGSGTIASFKRDAGANGQLDLSFPAQVATLNASSSLAFQTAATERMRLTSTGLGIGTISPDVKLHLSDSTSGSIIRLERNDTAIVAGDIYGGIEFEGQDASTTASGVRGSITGVGAGGAGNMDLVFNTAKGGTTDNLQRLRISSIGDISFYEDTGTTAKLFWDASAESLGIGTTTPFDSSIHATGKIRAGGGASSGFLFGSTDFDTGMITPADGNLAFTVDGIERLRISSGNVGIGTSSPASKLHVQDSVGSPQIRIDNQGTASGIASLLFRSGGAGNPSSIIQSGGTSSGNQGIVFKHGDFGAEVERMRIDSSGNVGVGTSSPSSYFSPQLVVHSSSNLGGITIRSNATTDTNYLLFADGTSGNERYRGYVSYDHNTDTMKLATGASPAITIDSSQNVGIGTTSPSFIFHALSASPKIAAGSSIAMETTNDTELGGFVFNTHYNLQERTGMYAVGNYSTSGFQPDLTFKTSNTRRLTILGNGNVGIGTTSPSQKLHIGSTTSNPTGIGLQNSQRYYAIRSNNYSLVFSDETVGQERMRIDSSGNVGVGESSPDQKLHVSQAINNGFATVKIENSFGSTTAIGTGSSLQFSGWDAGVTANIKSVRTGSSYSPSALTFETFGGAGTTGSNTLAERMRIDEFGNVGIGTDDVTDKLTIYANAGNGITFDGISASAATEQDVSDIKFINRRSSGTTVKANIKHITHGTANGSALTFGTTTGAGAAERMRITSSGDVGIGTTDPDQRLHIADVTSCVLIIEGGNTGGSYVNFADTDDQNVGQIAYDHTSNFMGFRVNDNEKMRIDSSGNLLVGTTANGNISSAHEIRGSSSSGGNSILTVNNTSGTAQCPALNVANRDASTDSSNRFVQFYADYTGSTATAMGGIVGNGASNVQFATISDVREKQNIEALTNSLDKITSLNPVEFDWITSGEHCKAGFIAQEVEEVFPEFVVENMASEGQEERKGLTGGMTGGIVAHLVKAIQEQQTLIESLTTRIAALEE